MSIVFFGSSEFSLASLKACIDSGIPVSLIITTPDVQKGRGLQTQQTPVKIFAREKNISFIDPQKLKDAGILEQIQKISPDYFVVASYGKMIPGDWLKIPKKLAINVHPSLLPKYRGAAPLNWPILNGDEETGLSLAEVTDKLDAGDIFYQQAFKIGSQTDAAALNRHLEDMSYLALKETLSKLKAGQTVSRKVQDESQTCYARKLSKEDAVIRWNRSAQEIGRQVRGLQPWPGTCTFFQGQQIQILQVNVLEASSAAAPGTAVEIFKQSFSVQTGKGTLEILKVKPAGKNEMSAGDFARGKRLEPGAAFKESAS